MIRRTIEDRAAEFLGKHGIVKAPVPVEQMALREGIRIARSPAEGAEAGFLLRDGHVVLIGLNSKNTRRRQRFTIAHELGHWLLHEGRPLIVDHSVRINKRDGVSSEATNQEEIDANAFGAALLMPESFVRLAADRELRLGVTSRDQLTQALTTEFDVSNEAMNIRLINLGIFTA